MCVDLATSNEPLFGAADGVLRMPLPCLDQIIRHFHDHDVTKVVHVGDLGIIRDHPDQYTAFPDNFDGDKDMIRLIQKTAEIEDCLAHVEKRFAKAEIAPVHLSQVTQDFKVRNDWVVRPENGLAAQSLKLRADNLRRRVGEMTQNGHVRPYARTSLVFDDASVIAQSPQSTHGALRMAENELKLGKVRTFVKLATTPADVTLAAPIFGAAQLEECIDAKVDLVVLDSSCGVLGELDAVCKQCKEHGIFILGMCLTGCI